MCGRDPDRLAAAQAALVAAGAPDPLALQADPGNAASVGRLVPEVAAAFGGLDGLVVNSVHIAFGGLEDLEEADWEVAFDLLLMSAVRLSRAAIAPMAEAGGGDMVFLTRPPCSRPQAICFCPAFSATASRRWRKAFRVRSPGAASG
ncbi:SDR family NAD(P)-dependent oxidoreductase [Pseudogemmobacter sonorensis]|uniref:SDR family NAD(P)-dependent oxidoreductase n=1 Tax=Pseudogemmobacter sonorensis TaxID=2989681 RepID=UPI003680CECD